MTFLKIIDQLFSKIIEVFIIVLTTIMIVSAFLQVVFRFVFNNPLTWSEDAAIYSMIWIVYIAGYLTLLEGSNLGMNFIFNKLPALPATIISLLFDAMIFCFIVVIATEGMKLAMSLAYARSPSLRISLFFPYSSIPISAIIMGVAMLKIFFFHLTRLKKMGE